MSNKFEQYKGLMKRVADVHHTIALLHWDQETIMPSKGAAFRAQQIGTLAGISHEMFVDEKLGGLLNELNNDSSLNEREAKNIQETLKDYEKKKKYPTEFVEKLSVTVAESTHVWEKAREADDFSMFELHLQKVIELKRQECDILGYEEHPYNAMLDNFEPGAKVADLDVLFTDVRKQLVDFVKKIGQKAQVEDSFLKKHYDHQKQWDFGIDLLKQMHYDFDAGLQELSAHPFTTNFNPCDVRVTTRINENDFTSMTWSCIHEGGHALYEQGLSTDDYGLPTGDAISLGVHESQSRLWENHVGRGYGYWVANYPHLQGLFDENLSNVSLDEFYKAINLVKPSLIRVEADELTYHSHILIRYEIEKALMAGDVEVKDLPEYWNSKYKEYLDVDVPSNKEGVLQDIHWSSGLIGYFPTYSIGSFYSAQYFAKAKEEIPDLTSQIESGELKPLLDWLRDKIHQHGRMYSAEELCVKVTGEKLNFQHFMDYAEKKYSEIYDLKMEEAL
ncbi:MAG: carboxypeptidase [Bacteroidetes bacterium]|nr:carboxypeptidase M32 [Bacteroidia bacterium]PCH67985.1 MAG: carboxypeptidase [Bacteroidota bacterium]